MAAELRLPRSIGLRFDVPEGPDLCETCRERPAAGTYCSRLCELYDTAHGALVEALTAADGDRTAPELVAARTRMRAIALVFDADRIMPAGGRLQVQGAAAEWLADVRAGLLLPVSYAFAVAAVRAELARSG